jgi:hypothetical protein
VLSPYHVQAVLAHLSDPSSGFAVDVAKLSEDHVYWELVSPRNGSEVDASGQVPLTVVLKAGRSMNTPDRPPRGTERA